MPSKPATVTFISRFSQHRLSRRAHIETPLAVGAGWVTALEPIRYQFAPGVEDGQLVGMLTVHEGQDKIIDHGGALASGQEQGVERDAPEWLRAHKEFGHDFWQQGHAPGTKYPRPQDFRRDLIRAVGKLDEETLVAMQRRELDTHGRADLLAEVSTALEGVREEQAQIALAQQQAEEAAKPAAKAKPKAPAAA